MALLSDGATWFFVFRMQEVSSLKRRASMNFAHKEVQLAWRVREEKIHSQADLYYCKGHKLQPDLLFVIR